MSFINNLLTRNHTRPAAPPAAAPTSAPRPAARPEAPRDRVELSAEARQSTYTVPNESNDFVRDSIPDRPPEVRQRQEATIRSALTSGGQSFEMNNSAGQRETYTLRAGEANGAYELRGQDGHTLRVSLDEQMSESQRVSALASITDFHSRIPPHLRDALDEVTVDNDPYPTSNGQLEGFARRSSITIYNGLNFIDNGVLDHEFAHTLGNKLEMEQAISQSSNPVLGGEISPVLGPSLFPSHVPPGWGQAVRQDGSAPSQYARDNGAAEDFAESYVAYREAQEHGPEALEALRRQYPERMRHLDEVMTPPRTFFTALFESLGTPAWPLSP